METNESDYYCYCPLNLIEAEREAEKNRKDIVKHITMLNIQLNLLSHHSSIISSDKTGYFGCSFVISLTDDMACPSPS